MQSSLTGAVAFVTLAICIRPTMTPFWVYMGAELTLRTARNRGVPAALQVIFTSLLTRSVILAQSDSDLRLSGHSAAMLGTSTLFDYTITGQLSLPPATFIYHNVLRNISRFYGATNYAYHLTQSLPIMLFPIWWWWGQGIVSCLLPSSILPKRLFRLDRPEALCSLARAITFAIAILSLSPHSEWRFLHPLLPPLLLFALPPMFRLYGPIPPGRYHFAQIVRQYTRLPKLPFYLCLFAPIVPYLYLNGFHGRAQVQVMDVLRRGEIGNVSGLVALMPCHSTPWMSSLHRDIDAWFLTCEPPLRYVIACSQEAWLTSC